jgi:N-methylhydantoinase A/acetophenone carboxylase
MRGEGFDDRDIAFTVEAVAYAGRDAVARIGPLGLGPELPATIGALAEAASGAHHLELRLAATGAMPHGELLDTGERSADTAGARIGTRVIITPAGETTVPLYRFDRLPIGGAVAGPAIAETDQTSILIPAGRVLRIDAHGGGLVEVRP